jgi:hypothetical protein
MSDPLAAARGIVFGALCGFALYAFMLGAVIAAADEEQAGAVCMIVAAAASMLATIVGANNANAQD